MGVNPGLCDFSSPRVRQMPVGKEFYAAAGLDNPSRLCFSPFIMSAMRYGMEIFIFPRGGIFFILKNNSLKLLGEKLCF
jgi:hypothetical protein